MGMGYQLISNLKQRPVFQNVRLHLPLALQASPGC
jgi:hypothetical protein